MLRGCHFEINDASIGDSLLRIFAPSVHVRIVAEDGKTRAKPDALPDL
jgi:hypothetical protein